MARRRIAEKPRSRLAVWARRLAVFALPVAALAVVFERTGMFEIFPVLATFGASLVLALLAILLALAALASIWVTGRSGAGHAMLALVLGLLLLAYPSYLGLKGLRLPEIHDVTTDPYDPPRFEAVARLRTREANPVAYGGLSIYQLQRIAYPDVEPLEVNATPQQAYDAALAVVTKRKWRIVDARAPQPNRREGRIEAIALSPIMGFRDDVVIRVRISGGGSRIDIRSASRYGWHDFGTNASRVTSLLEAIDEATSPERTERAMKKTIKPANTPQPGRR
ncbi:MAG TPA: DUF1499 domain-containing protein [Xanthobacteraceae bacterium]|nr:DUF1499 domain-containing protein [Xanthobacteraceae bacterium]